MPAVPQLGEDYSVEVSDGSTTTVAVLDSLDTYANHDCVMFMTPVQAKSITLVVEKANGNTATTAIMTGNCEDVRWTKKKTVLKKIEKTKR